MEVRWTYSAINDLQEFKENTKIIKPNEYISNLINNIELLVQNPELGKSLMIISNKSIRQFIFEHHRILYYIESNKIHIISIVHHKQNITNKITYIKRNIKSQ